MIIKNMEGAILFEGRHRSIRAALEHCARHDICLLGANLRRARLNHAALDGLNAPGACLWGALLAGADLCGANLRGADLRGANLQEACLVEADLREADMRGAWLGSTLLGNTDLRDSLQSCPALWRCDLSSAKCSGMTFLPMGEAAARFMRIPIAVSGFANMPIIFGEDFCLWRNRRYDAGRLPKDLRRALQSLCAMTSSMLGDPHAATYPKDNSQCQLN